VTPRAPDAREETGVANRRLLKRLLVVAVGMFGFGFLLVPFYEQICEVTGLRNIAQPDAVENTQVVTTRTIRLELDSNVRHMAWTFKPVEPFVDVHPGELRQVVYEITNNSDRAITGQAIPSYGPQHAAPYFRKLECFCFTQQTLQAGETRRMPVVFVIDPKAPDDLGTITLSYTFFEVEGAATDIQGAAKPRAQGITTRSDS
jgi:cytochrome c oxidase assembly protein subunit 11